MHRLTKRLCANTLPSGARFEYRVHFPGEKTKYADLVWPQRTLLEMKSRGVKLSKHYQQTFDYWLNLVPHRPPYVVLCNFDEFWVYDFNVQNYEPVDRFQAGELAARTVAGRSARCGAASPAAAVFWVAKAMASRAGLPFGAAGVAY